MTPSESTEKDIAPVATKSHHRGFSRLPLASFFALGLNLGRFAPGNVKFVRVFAAGIVGATLVVAQSRHKTCPTRDMRAEVLGQ